MTIAELILCLQEDDMDCSEGLTVNEIQSKTVEFATGCTGATFTVLSVYYCDEQDKVFIDLGEVE